jgi:hypothetical protein
MDTIQLPDDDLSMFASLPTIESWIKELEALSDGELIKRRLKAIRSLHGSTANNRTHTLR